MEKRNWTVKIYKRDNRRRNGLKFVRAISLNNVTISDVDAYVAMLETQYNPWFFQIKYEEYNTTIVSYLVGE